jgi:hypothetical protein
MRSVSGFSCCIAAVALFLALPSSASAASRTKRRTTRTETPSAPAPAPAPEATTAEAAAGQATPAAAGTAEPAKPQLASSAPPALTARSSLDQGPIETPKYSISLGVGPTIPLAGGPIGFELVARGLFNIPAQAGKATLWFVLPMRLNTWGMEVAGFKTSVVTLALVPTVQASGVVAPRLRGYASVGAGLAHARATVEVPFIGPQTTGSTAVEFDVSSGIEYALDERFSIILEPMGLRLFTGAQETCIAVQGFVTCTQQGRSALWTMLLGVGAAI